MKSTDLEILRRIRCRIASQSDEVKVREAALLTEELEYVDRLTDKAALVKAHLQLPEMDKLRQDLERLGCEILTGPPFNPYEIVVQGTPSTIELAQIRLRHALEEATQRWLSTWKSKAPFVPDVKVGKALDPLTACRKCGFTAAEHKYPPLNVPVEDGPCAKFQAPTATAPRSPR